MTSASVPSVQELRSEILTFRNGFRSFVLATVGADGTPDASYAPYIMDDNGNFYIYVSGLSQHTRDLQASGRASVLFLEEERAAQNLFARRRLSFRCEAIVITRDSTEWLGLLDRFADRFGKFMETLRSLPDFQLFRLAPRLGSYVRGFGQAYVIDGARLDAIHPITAARLRSADQRDP